MKEDTCKKESKEEESVSYVEKLKRHPIIATIVLLSVVIAGVAKLIESKETIEKAIDQAGPCEDSDVDNRPIHCMEGK